MLAVFALLVGFSRCLRRYEDRIKDLTGCANLVDPSVDASHEDILIDLSEVNVCVSCLQNVAVQRLHRCLSCVLHDGISAKKLVCLRNMSTTINNCKCSVDYLMSLV